MTLAVRYLSARTLDTAPAATATPGPGEVEVAPAFVGICGTDLHIFHGDMDARVQTPAVLGHEMSGRIVSVGDGVEGWAPGDAVTVMPLRWDDTCPACQAGNQHICHNLDFIGIDSPGAMQQRWTVPASTLVRLPGSVPLDHAALVEPTAVAVHDVGRAAVRDGEKVVVVGGGPVGILIALVARNAGADARVIELSPHRRLLAEDLGLATWDPSAADVTALVGEWTGNAGADVAFEVSGAAGGVDTAVDVLGVRGRLCLVAIHPKPREINLHRFFWRELTLVGARLYHRADFEQAVALVADGTVPAAKLISKVVPLTEAPAAFEALEGGGNVMKILVDCTTETQGAGA
ncbi:alcohol dehydrogenase catalytic domain-containing protein [Streptomyces scabiei]|uniref:zinc-dependent alcohol dehydrogenase n=1 Tax=Streptomyces scabiei TaxID=1930 RepID=UPI001B302A61|nr:MULTISPECIES: alcohol dehydrogenase catalytic domain-containing protein [Streptomyces]MBP5880278.1 alcohol dehydrogenase catalytic domain-containing protein [Streptomyces sp. LBUM 1477]MBP5888120.1 alcohol dehydrogenase catalytic domain-containing protein [Streptomyces sp. LBUM 1487]MBP5904134.1 alcohol dehydrogenase catalytic domain-containing protein [Streptomyces sp. LBUM 1488]MDW8477792.1 alcohol dehydrogenase catalytic domain-containing protein [Streptomyces scabiei]MDX2567250.1 alcoho